MLFLGVDIHPYLPEAVWISIITQKWYALMIIFPKNQKSQGLDIALEMTSWSFEMWTWSWIIFIFIPAWLNLSERGGMTQRGKFRTTWLARYLVNPLSTARTICISCVIIFLLFWSICGGYFFVMIFILKYL